MTHVYTDKELIEYSHKIFWEQLAREGIDLHRPEVSREQFEISIDREEIASKDRKQVKALSMVYHACHQGDIIYPNRCELCGSNKNIVAHHHRGYDFPLDVWFICSSCNTRLKAPEFHMGVVTKLEAQAIVLRPIASQLIELRRMAREKLSKIK